MDKINLWLDDLRPAPDGWVWAKNVNEAQKLFLENEVVDASLDHDLGLDGMQLGLRNGLYRTMEDALNHPFSEESGLTMVNWMAENEMWPDNLSVHSANPIGAANMAAVIDSQGPYFNKYSYEWEDHHVEGWLWIKN